MKRLAELVPGDISGDVPHLELKIRLEGGASEDEVCERVAQAMAKAIVKASRRLERESSPFPAPAAAPTPNASGFAAEPARARAGGGAPLSPPREFGTRDRSARAGAVDASEREADRLGARIASELPHGDALGTGPLPQSVQAVAERAFGVDFSGVELRADAQGESKALAHNAFAVADGSSIHFAKGQANLTSEYGRKLLGHELAHVAQARLGTVPAGQAQARSFPKVHQQVLQELIRAKREDPSFSQVKGLLGRLDKEEAQGLFQRITSGSKRDDFAVFFNSNANVPADMREELLAVLKRRSGGAAAGVSGQAEPKAPSAVAESTPTKTEPLAPTSAPELGQRAEERSSGHIVAFGPEALMLAFRALPNAQRTIVPDGFGAQSSLSRGSTPMARCS